MPDSDVRTPQWWAKNRKKCGDDYNFVTREKHLKTVEQGLQINDINPNPNSLKNLQSDPPKNCDSLLSQKVIMRKCYWFLNSTGVMAEPKMGWKVTHPQAPYLHHCGSGLLQSHWTLEWRKSDTGGCWGFFCPLWTWTEVLRTQDET